jgi:hypothetical protein
MTESDFADLITAISSVDIAIINDSRVEPTAEQIKDVVLQLNKVIKNTGLEDFGVSLLLGAEN